MWFNKFFIASFFAKFIKLLIKPSDFSGCRSQPRCPPGHQYCVFIIGSTKARLLINHQAELLCYQFKPLLYLTVGECQAIVTSIPERGIFPCFKKLTIFLHYQSIRFCAKQGRASFFSWFYYSSFSYTEFVLFCHWYDIAKCWQW